VHRDSYQYVGVAFLPLLLFVPVFLHILLIAHTLFFREEVPGSMDFFALSKLVTFGGEISRRLIAFSDRIDEVPSSILSIGYEIRSTCDVL